VRRDDLGEPLAARESRRRLKPLVAGGTRPEYFRG
jgi:hypothetical protein